MATPLNDTRSAVPVLVVVLGLAASLFTFSLVSKAEREDEQERFRQRADQAADQLEGVVQHQLEVLRLLQGYYRHAPAGDSSSLPAFLGHAIDDEVSFEPLAYVAWVRLVEPSALASYEREQRLVEPDFRLRGVNGAPPEDGDDDRHQPGSDHWIVEQVASRRPGGLLHGLDLGSDPERRAALEGAVRTGGTTTSQRVRVAAPTEETGTEGVLLALPVYSVEPPPLDEEGREEHVRGAVVGLLALQPLLDKALSTAGSPPEPAVNITVCEKDAQHTVLASVGPPGLVDMPSASAELEVADRIWLLQMRPAAELRRTVAEWLDRTSVVLPTAVFVVMCLVSWIVWAQQRQTAVIREQVARQTTELRQKNLVLVGKERELEDANRRLLEMSNTDALTGILNRRAFEVQLDKERDRSRRSGAPFGLLVFDIDSFKDYNDRYGHAAGDEVLRTVAQLIHNEARRIDCVARYGGEEFVILASGIDATGLMALAERVRLRVQQAGIENSGSPHGVVTISGGGSLSAAADGGDPRPVFELADRCLYQAKTTGRNRVVMVM